MKILARWTKLIQILYTYMWTPRKLKMQKLTTQRGGGSKIKILALWTKGLLHSLQKAEKSQPKHSVKKQTDQVRTSSEI